MESNFDEVQSINFQNEKDFNLTIDEILNFTRSLEHDWKYRESSLKRLVGIIKGNYGSSMNFLKTLNNKVYLNLGFQMLDSRTTLMNTACRVLVLCAEKYKALFEVGCEKILSQNFIFKLISSANKVIGENGFQCGFSLIKNVQTQKVLMRIIDQSQSKNSLVREKACLYLLYVLDFYKSSLIQNNTNPIEEFIINAVSDTNQEVRLRARDCYRKYKEKYNDQGEAMFKKFPKNVKKVLTEEEIKVFLTEDSFKNKENLYNSSVQEGSSIMSDPTEQGSVKTHNNTFTKRNRSISREPRQESKFMTQCVKGHNKIQLQNVLNSTVIAQPKDLLEKVINSKNKEPEFKNLVKLIKEVITALDSSKENEETEKILSSLNNMFTEIYNQYDNIASSLISNIISMLIRIAIKNNSLTKTCLKMLYKYLYYLHDVLNDNQLVELFELLFKNISSNEEQKDISNNLIELIRKKISFVQLVDSSTKYLIEKDIRDPEIMKIFFEFINVLIDNNENEHVFNEKNFKKLVCHFASLLEYFSKNKEILYKIIDFLEKLFKINKLLIVKCYQEIQNPNTKMNFINILDIYQKQMSKYIKENEFSYYVKTNSEEKQIKEVQEFKINKKTNKLFKLYPDDYNEEISINTEFLFLSNSSSSKDFMKYIKAQSSNLEMFLLSLTSIQSNEINSVLSHIYYMLEQDCEMFLIHTDMLLNRLLFIGAKFYTKSFDQLKLLLTFITKNFDSEMFVQIITKYLTQKMDSELKVLCLKHFSSIIKTISSEDLLFLVPSFIDNIVILLSDQSVEVRKAAVFSVVEVSRSIGEDFKIYLQQLSQNDRNLVSIYLKKGF